MNDESSDSLLQQSAPEPQIYTYLHRYSRHLRTLPIPVIDLSDGILRIRLFSVCPAAKCISWRPGLNLFLSSWRVLLSSWQSIVILSMFTCFFALLLLLFLLLLESPFLLLDLMKINVFKSESS